MTIRKGTAPPAPILSASQRVPGGRDGKFIVSIPPGWETSPIFDISGLVAWTWLIREKKAVYSPVWRELLGEPPDSDLLLEGDFWRLPFHEDDIYPFLEVTRDIVEGVTESYQSLYRVRRKDGDWIWLLSRGKVVEKDADGPVRVCGALMDVTFLRHNAAFLQGRAGLLLPRLHVLPIIRPSGAAEAAPGPCRPQVPASGTGSVSFRTHIFYSPEEEPLGDMAPSQEAVARQYVRQVFAEGIALEEMVTFNAGSGNEVTGEYSLWPVFDPQGEVLAVVAQYRDLSNDILEKRRARRNEMRLAALYTLTQMSGAPEEEVMVFVVERLVELTESKGGFLFFPYGNSKNRGRMIWSKRSGHIPPEAFQNAAALPAELARLAMAEDGQSYQSVISNGNYLQPIYKLFDGALPITRYIAVPFFEERRLVCLAVVFNKEKDVYREDDRAQLEAFVNGAWLVLRRHETIRELRRAKDGAERASKVKDEFLANVSHELRTPLNGILSMLQLLELLELTEEQRSYVEAAAGSGRALLRIISDILDFARIEAKKMQLQIEPFDFKQAFQSSLDLFRREAKEKGLSFDCELDENIPPALLGDEARVRQILFNLVGNALKFTDHGGIRVECSLLPYAEEGHVRVYLAVADTGIGISFADQARVFEAFTQIDSSPTRKYQGSGLGLGIVRKLLRLMNGGMCMESGEGMGTTIHCSLRFAIPAEETVSFGTVEAVQSAGEETPLHILVAEDDAVGRFALRKFLQNMGHLPVCVPDGRLALEILQLHRFDCLFTDIQMPGMDGLEVVRRIREGRLEGMAPSAEAARLLQAALPGEYGDLVPVPRDLIAVAITAHSMRGDKERFLRAGMDMYIAKPVEAKDLREILRNIAARFAAARKK